MEIGEHTQRLKAGEVSLRGAVMTGAAITACVAVPAGVAAV
jgi:hypothetical protein